MHPYCLEIIASETSKTATIIKEHYVSPNFWRLVPSHLNPTSGVSGSNNPLELNSGNKDLNRMDHYYPVALRSFHKDGAVEPEEIWKTGGFTFMNSARIVWDCHDGLQEADKINIIVVHDGLILASKTFLADEYFNMCNVPYGYVKPGENVDVAFQRILYSTTGIEADLTRSFKAYRYPIHCQGIQTAHAINYLYMIDPDVDEEPMADLEYGDYWFWMDAVSVAYSNILSHYITKDLRKYNLGLSSVDFTLNEVCSLTSIRPLHCTLNTFGVTKKFSKLCILSRDDHGINQLRNDPETMLWMVKPQGELENFLNKLITWLIKGKEARKSYLECQRTDDVQIRLPWYDDLEEFQTNAEELIDDFEWAYSDVSDDLRYHQDDFDDYGGWDD